MIRKFDYKSAAFNRTFDTYDHVDCFNFMDLHDYLKLVKHGYSKVTDHASREIRHGRITRKEGLALVKRFEQQPTQFNNLFLDWLGITKHGLEFMIDQHRNGKFWIESSPGNWSFNGWSTLQTGMEQIQEMTETPFHANCVLDNREYPTYITIGKGYP